MPPELQDIIKKVESGMSLRDAVDSYFFRKGLPIIQQQIKQDTIAAMKKKAKNTSETSSTSSATSTSFKRTSDADSILDQIYEMQQQT